MSDESGTSGGSDVPGGAIHGDHPFLPPERERNQIRRLRARLVAPVTLWTAVSSAESGGRRAGLPVSALLVVDGEPGRILGLVDEDSELWGVAARVGRLAVAVLRWEHRSVADAFAGLLPSPGGPFRTGEWRDTEWGPVPASVQTWAGCRVVDSRPVGWSLAVEAEIEHLEIGDETDPLLHRRGRYLTIPESD